MLLGVLNCNPLINIFLYVEKNVLIIILDISIHLIFPSIFTYILYLNFINFYCNFHAFIILFFLMNFNNRDYCCKTALLHFYLH